MNFIPTSPPEIHPLPQSEMRPLWSVMIPVYNCSQFLPDTLQSVLMQNIPEAEMQIEVVDDASTDADVESIVRQIGAGRIRYYRQPQNAGSLRNFETCINRAQGRLVHILHGDDKVKTGYYKAIQDLFQEYPQAGAAFCRYQTFDEKGNIIKNDIPRLMLQNGLLANWLLRISQKNLIQYATITVRREVYERLGAFYGTTYGEDWEMWVRIAKYYPVAYTPDILAEYRKHSNSISGKKFLTGKYMKDLTYVFNLIQNHLPNENKKEVLKAAKKNYAYYGMSVTNSLWRKHRNKTYVMVNIKQVFNMHTDATLCFKAAKLITKIILNRS